MIGGGLGPWAPGEWTDDTDTGAAIAGGLLGARWGASAVPPAWCRLLHRWPGDRADDLVRLADLCAPGAAR